MPTTKQLDYINELEQVAEKGSVVGTYPGSLPSKGSFDADKTIEEMEGDSKLSFDNHSISSEAYLYFYYPELLIHYGLGEAREVGYIALCIDDDIEFPETINDENSLKQWMLTNDFITAVMATGPYVDDVQLSNEVADYMTNNNWTLSLQNGQLIMTENLKCLRGEGERIIDASDPINEPALKVENLEVENVFSNQIKTWYFVQGWFWDTGEVKYNIIPQYVTLDANGRYVVPAIAWENQQFEHINQYLVDFTTSKVYTDGSVEINLDGAKIELVDALTGEVKKLVEY